MDQYRDGPGEVETRWQKKDGTIINVLLSSTPVDLSDLSSRGYLHCTGYHRQKQAEAVLKESETLYRTVFEDTGNRDGHR